MRVTSSSNYFPLRKLQRALPQTKALGNRMARATGFGLEFQVYAALMIGGYSILRGGVGNPQNLARSELQRVRYVLDGGGKRFRAELLHVSYQLAGGRGDPPAFLARLIELLHAGSLVAALAPEGRRGLDDARVERPEHARDAAEHARRHVEQPRAAAQGREGELGDLLSGAVDLK